VWSLNILLCFFIIFKLYLIAFIIYLIKQAYASWILTADRYCFVNHHLDVDTEWEIHIDFDTDATLYYKTFKAYYYMLFNCNFHYFSDKGSDLLNNIEFSNIVLYQFFDYRNFKYLYKNNFYKKNYNKKDVTYYSFIFKKKYEKIYNKKSNFKLFNEKNFSVLTNMDEINNINKKRRKIWYK
jgi:hypothetical protein